MEKVSLYIKRLDADGNEVLFPDAIEPAKIGTFTYNAQRMGGAPTITATLMYKRCLDDEWTHEEYVEFRGEKYYVTQVPTSSKSNEETFYKHEIEFQSERAVLDNTYFFDVVTDDIDEQYADRYRSNNSSVTFYGDINEFAARLTSSMIYSGLCTCDADTKTYDGYHVVVDDGITSDTLQASFEDKYLSEALQEIYNTFELSYYFVGKVCHVGYTENAITTPFEYGIRKGLLSITKTNANYKLIDRITGCGSSDNIPYYYPNESADGTATYVTEGFDSSLVQSINLKTLRNAFGSSAGTFTWAQSTVSINSSNTSTRLYFTTDGEVGYFTQTTNTYHNLSCSRTGVAFVVTPRFSVGDGNVSSIRYKAILNGTEVTDGYVTIENTTAGDDITVEISKANQVYTLQFVVQVKVYNYSTSTTTTVARAFSDISDVTSPSTGYGFTDENGIFVSYGDCGIIIPDYDLLEIGDTITITGRKYITPQSNLMPSIYRESAERFYNATNNTYDSETYLPDSTTDNPIVFNNPYIKGNQHEAIQDFDDIKPTIEGITNADGELIGVIEDIAFDDNDSDVLGNGEANKVFNDTDEYVHSYFYIKLRIFNGDLGFNLFNYALADEEAYIEMTSGNCAACKFQIGVLKEQVTEGSTVKYKFYNPVQVDSNGDIVSGDFEEKVKAKEYRQDQQQSTLTNSVWIAVKKENDTFGIVMPNCTNNYKPQAGDTFVITGISMPKAYYLAAEKRLDAALVKYMAENNDEKFQFSANFSRVYLADNEEIANLLNENARLIVKYNDKDYTLYVSDYTVKADDNILYEVSLELTDTLSIGQSSIKQQISAAKADILSSINNGKTQDILAQGTRYWLSKLQDDSASGVITFLKGILFGSGKYSISEEGVARLKKIIVEAITSTDITNSGTISTKDLIVTGTAHFFQLIIDKLNSVDGAIMATNAHAKISRIVWLASDAVLDGGDTENVLSETEYAYDTATPASWDVCRLLWKATDDNEEAVENTYVANDGLVCWDTKGLTAGTTFGASNKYYWCKVGAVGTITYTDGHGEDIEYNYVDIYSTDVTTEGDYYDGSFMPALRDVTTQLGYFGSDTDTLALRGNAIIMSAYATPDQGGLIDGTEYDAIEPPSLVQYKGIKTCVLAPYRMNVQAANGNVFKGSFVAIASSGEEYDISKGTASMTLYAFKNIADGETAAVPTNATYNFATKEFYAGDNGWSADVPAAVDGYTTYVTLAVVSGSESNDSAIDVTSWVTPYPNSGSRGEKGDSGIAASLSNDASQIACSSDGTPLNSNYEPTTMTLYSGTQVLTATADKNVVFKVSINGTQIVTSTLTSGSATYTLTSALIAQYIAFTDDIASFEISVTYDGTTFTKTYTIAKVRAGATGDNGNTPTIGSDGYWYINGVSTGIKAEAEDGTSVTITSTSVTYQTSTSGTSAPTGTWQTSVPSLSEGQYLWTKTVVNYSDGKSTTAYSVSYKGTNGTDGKGISSTTVEYQAGTSGTTAPTGTWQTSVPTVGEGEYLWTKTTINYTSGNPSISYCVAYSGINGINGEDGADGKDGNDGRGISGSTVTYQTSTSGTTAPTGTWQSSVPTVSEGQYLWTKTTYTFTDGKTQDVYSVGYYGKSGAAVASVTNYYLASSSASGVTSSTSGWTTSIQTITKDKPYLWNYEITKDSNGNTVSTTSPTIIGHFGTDGKTGTSVTGIVEYYAVSSSNSTAPSSGWQTDSVPTMTTTNKYLWNYEVISYSDNTSDTTLKRVIGVYGDTGEDGTSVTIKSTSITYAVTTDSSQPSDSAFTSTSVPTVSLGSYLWSKTTITYSEGTVTTSYSVSRIGTDGKDGKSITGEDGKTSYVHFAYATSSDGKTGFSTTYFTGALYIGTCTDYNSADPTTYSSYEWARLRGEDGTSVTVSSTSITYSTNHTSTTQPADSTFTLTAIPTLSEGQYLWSKTTVNYSDGNSTTTYSVSRIGKNGEDGTSVTISTTAVTYAVNQTGTQPADSAFTYTSIPTLSQKDYLWTRTYIKYSDGTETNSYSVGRIGADGEDGQSIAGTSNYIHIAYADSATGTNFSTTYYSGALYIGTCVTETSTDPTTYSSYEWNRIKGEDGKGISSVTEQYTLNNSSTTAPTSGWGTAIQTPTATNKYLWNREVIAYTTGTSDTTTAHIVSMYAADGKGISSVTNYYLASASSTGVTASTSGFTTDIQTATASKPYLWNYEKITYTTGDSDTTTPCIIGMYSEDGHSPYIDTTTNTWWVWDATTSAYKDSGVKPQGTSGEDAITLALDNEADIIQYDSAGNLITTNGVSTTATLYKGANALTTGVTFAYEVTAGTATVAQSSNAFTVSALTSDSAEVTIKATYNSVTYSKIFSIKKITGFDKYELVLSSNSVKVNTSGACNPSTITVGVWRTSQDGTRTNITNTLGDYSLEVEVTSRTGTSSVEGNVLTRNSNSTSAISFTPSNTYSLYRVLLRNVNVTSEYYDIETIPVVSDGEKGESVEGKTYSTSLDTLVVKCTKNSSGNYIIASDAADEKIYLTCSDSSVTATAVAVTSGSATSATTLTTSTQYLNNIGYSFSTSNQYIALGMNTNGSLTAHSDKIVVTWSDGKSSTHSLQITPLVDGSIEDVETTVVYRLKPITERASIVLSGGGTTALSQIIDVSLGYTVLRIEGETTTELTDRDALGSDLSLDGYYNNGTSLSFDEYLEYNETGSYSSTKTSITVTLTNASGTTLDQRIVPFSFEQSSALSVTNKGITAISQNATDISTVEQTANSVKSTVSTLQGQMSTIEQKADSISLKVNSGSLDSKRWNLLSDGMKHVAIWETFNAGTVTLVSGSSYTITVNGYTNNASYYLCLKIGSMVTLYGTSSGTYSGTPYTTATNMTKTFTATSSGTFTVYVYCYQVGTTSTAPPNYNYYALVNWITVEEGELSSGEYLLSADDYIVKPNLLRGTQKFATGSYGSGYATLFSAATGSSYTVELEDNSFQYAYYKNTTANTDFAWFHDVLDNTAAGDIYTLSFYAKCSSSGYKMYVGFCLSVTESYTSSYYVDSAVDSEGNASAVTNSDGCPYVEISLTTSWKQYWVTFYQKEAATALTVALCRMISTGVTYYLAAPKLRKGGRCDAWSDYGISAMNEEEIALLDTGIDIQNRKIRLAADTTEFVDNSGNTMGVFTNGGLQAGSLQTTTGTAGQYIYIENGLITVTGTGQSKIEFGCDEEGYPIMRYIGSSGELLWNLGKNGISSSSVIAESWTSYTLVALADTGITIPSAGATVTKAQAYVLFKKGYDTHSTTVYRYTAACSNGVYAASTGYYSMNTATKAKSANGLYYTSKGNSTTAATTASGYYMQVQTVFGQNAESTTTVNSNPDYIRTIWYFEGGELTMYDVYCTYSMFNIVNA